MKRDQVIQDWCIGLRLLVLATPLLIASGPVNVEEPMDSAQDYKQRLELMPRQVRDVQISERLGQTVPLNLLFTDERGGRVSLGDYTDGHRPILLTLNYYRCPKLCTLQLNGVVDAIKELDLIPGRDYQIVTVSFDPAETPQLARLKKQNYIRATGKPSLGTAWHFLTGEQHNIKALSESVGYRYKWLDSQQQYAHPAAMMLLSPEGVLTRYLYGIKFDPKTVRLSLVEAAEGRIGSTVDRLLLTCFQYDPASGTYVAGAMMLMRLGGALTVLILAITIGLMLRREFRRRKVEQVAPPLARA